MTSLQKLTIALLSLALVGCGSTSEARKSSNDGTRNGTPTASQPGNPGQGARTPRTADTGTTDKGSRYLEFSDPLGAVPVESDPLGNDTSWSPPTTPVIAQPDVIGRPPPQVHKVPPLPPLDDDK